MEHHLDFLKDKEFLQEINQTTSWPFEEAKKIIKRYRNFGYPKTVVFQTGYGPSGLPHIGTFGEVARTSMVCHAFRILTKEKINTKLICFSDDMDALRKIPRNINNSNLLEKFIEKPLSKIPDISYEGDNSFGESNNKKLCSFLDKFNFSYNFISATEYYESGKFDKILIKILILYKKIIEIILPSLGEERKKTYSPFLPISKINGKILQVPITSYNIKEATISYIDPENNKETTTEIFGGQVKCQWKIDWAMRWIVLGTSYEMSGKDLIDSFKLSSKICKILEGIPPEGFHYELFLDENGKKISKSQGNGLPIKNWIQYAPLETLSFYMYKKPKTARKLYFGIIPKTVDEYYCFLSLYNNQTWKERLQNPVWHIHNGYPPSPDIPISFSMLLNIVSASNAEDKKTIWGFISKYKKFVKQRNYPDLDCLINYAIVYFKDFIKPKKKFRIPDEIEVSVLKNIKSELEIINKNSDGNAIQNILLNAARVIPRYQDQRNIQNNKDPRVSLLFFKMLYEILIGQTSGPRFGSFIEIYGIDETINLISESLDRKN